MGVSTLFRGVVPGRVSVVAGTKGSTLTMEINSLSGNETEGYRGVWEWEMGRVCFRFLVRGFSFSRCHSYSKAGAGAKAEASDMLLVWHLRVIN